MISETSVEREDRLRKAADFLRNYCKSEFIALAAINPDPKGQSGDYIGVSVNPSDSVTILDFLSEHDGQRNLYFHVNPVRDVSIKKASLKDVASVNYFHVDLDPRSGADLAEEQKRIAKLLSELPRDDIPAPTYIVFSGGGYQAFWRLQEPVILNGESDAHELGLYNQQLSLVLGAVDACHSVDHLMRLPWTVNLPNARKRAKGRVETIATLIRADEESVYLRGDFKQAKKVGSPQLLPESNDVVRLDGAVVKIKSLDQLDEYKVSPRVKQLITEGQVGDELKTRKDTSRSSWLFDCVLRLVEFKVPDHIIYGIITDPTWKISESVIERPDLDRYARRQIKRAHDQAENPLLREMNDQYCIITHITGAGTRIVYEFLDSDGTLRWNFISKQDFELRFENTKVQVGNKFVPAAKWWLSHRERRQYRGMGFYPKKEEPADFNMWKGFAVKPVRGDCQPYLDHVRNVICSGNLDHYNYLLDWLANTVQNPDRPGRVAVVLRGKQGTGKGVFVQNFGALFGTHYVYASSPNQIVGQFTAHLNYCVVLFADEAFFAGDKKHESSLKALITEEQRTSEAKFQDAVTVPNYIHLLMASNSDWVVPADAESRRFFVLNVSDDRMQDTVYFNALQKFMVEQGGREALFDFLLSRDISKFNVWNFPKTEALVQQKELSMPEVDSWWYGALCAGSFDDTVPWSSEETFASVNNLFHEFKQNYRYSRMDRRRFSDRISILTNCGAPRRRLMLTRTALDSSPVMASTLALRIGSLHACRRAFQRVYRDITFQEIIDADANANTDLPF